jgi:hypothetical protein
MQIKAQKISYSFMFNEMEHISRVLVLFFTFDSFPRDRAAWTASSSTAYQHILQDTWIRSKLWRAPSGLHSLERCGPNPCQLVCIILNQFFDCRQRPAPIRPPAHSNPPFTCRTPPLSPSAERTAPPSSWAAASPSHTAPGSAPCSARAPHSPGSERRHPPLVRACSHSRSGHVHTIFTVQFRAHGRLRRAALPRPRP